MENLAIIFSFSVFYSLTCTSLQFLISCPKSYKLIEKRDYIGQHVSMIHAILATIMSFFVYIQEDGVDYNAKTEFSHVFILSNTVGYLIYDFFYAEIFVSHDWSMRAHHVFVIIGATVMTVAEYGGSPATSKGYLVCIILTEGANPLLKLSKILKMQGKGDSDLVKAVDLAFAAVFVTFRAGLCTLVNFNIWDSRIHLVTRLMMSSTYAVGLVWVAKILSILSKKISPNTSIESFFHFLSHNRISFTLCCFIWSLILPPLLHLLFPGFSLHIKFLNFSFI